MRRASAPDRFKVALSVESSDPEALLTWLQGRGDTAYRSQKPLRLRGDVTVAPEGFAIDAMKADIEGGTVEGRVLVSHKQADSRLPGRGGTEGGTSRSRCRHGLC